MAKVASIGECMIELRHRGESDLELGYGGDTLNFAVYLARLTRGTGVAVDYVTALGDDPYSDAMLAMWRAEGIGCELVARLPGRLPSTRSAPTSTASGPSPTGDRRRPRAMCCMACTAPASLSGSPATTCCTCPG
jgi:sugar/nucleoside kinase (ribokinase family)